MNATREEQYLREYSILKNQGKPFFPYAVAKDGAMACIVLVVIIAAWRSSSGPSSAPRPTRRRPPTRRGPSGTSSSSSSCCAWSSRRSWCSWPRSASPRSASSCCSCCRSSTAAPSATRCERPIATLGRHHHDRRDGLPHDPRRARRLAHRDRAHDGAPVRGGQGGHGLLRLPRLPQVRRERQHARPEPHRDRRRLGPDAIARTLVNPTSPMPSYQSLQGRTRRSSTSWWSTSRR